MDEEAVAARAMPGLLFAQELPVRPSYTIKQHGVMAAGSEKTAYRRIMLLAQLGLAAVYRGRFTIKEEVTDQPVRVIKKIVPSLLALKNARRFGRSYNDADVHFAAGRMPDSAMVTLDYRAHELTGFQSASDLYIYVDNVEELASFLKENGFCEGTRGRVVLLPKIGRFDNEVERVYLDCIARGGRSRLDALAIQLVYGDKVSARGLFPAEDVEAVREDLPAENRCEIAPASA